MYKIRYPAAWLLGLYLRLTGYKAITMPWQVIHTIVEPVEYPALMHHEAIHVDQIRRMGAWKWTLTYLWYLVTKGYDNHPYEIEAREKSGCR